MKTLFVLLVILFFNFYAAFSQAEETQELYIIGTMHTVPKIVKNSYKPLLKKALKYAPETIFVEAPMANDTISWEYLKKGWSKGYQNFYALSDSLQTTFNFEESKFDRLLNKEFDALSDPDLDYLINSFGYLRDNANYEFYQYIKRYGAEGAKKPTRHEDGDLTAKLALQLNLKRLQGVDDQQTNKEYHEGWNGCYKAGSKNGDNAINSKLNKKQYNGAIIPGLFGTLGNYVNSKKSLTLLHTSASFRYVTAPSDGCSKGTKYFDERNERIAKNVAKKMNESGDTKNILIIGAAHVIGLTEEFRKNYPNVKLKLIDDSI